MGIDEIAVLRGGHEPATRELCVDLTDIEGEIPRDLNGLHMPNGPNLRFEAPRRCRWFDGAGAGAGMLHSVSSERERAVYRKRVPQRVSHGFLATRLGAQGLPRGD